MSDERKPTPMEWMAVHFTPRNFILAVATAFTVIVYHNRIWAPFTAVYRRLNPRESHKTEAPPPDLEKQRQAQELRHFHSRYRRVSRLLDRSEAQGYPVRGHRAKLKAALKIARMGHRWQAQKILNEVEMTYPRKKEVYIPMNVVGPPGEDIPPDVQPTQARERPKPPPRRRSRR